MRTIKLICSMSALALLGVLLVGGNASAATLCKVGRIICPENKIYGPGTEFTADLEAGTRWVQNTNPGTEMKTSHVTIKLNEKAEPRIYGWTVSSSPTCGMETAGGIPWSGSLEASSSSVGDGNMTVVDPRWEMHCLATCAWHGDEFFAAEIQHGSGGGEAADAKLSLANQWLEPSKEYCGGGTVNATYRIRSAGGVSDPPVYLVQLP